MGRRVAAVALGVSAGSLFVAAATTAATAGGGRPVEPVASSVTTDVPGAPAEFVPVDFFTDFFTRIGGNPPNRGSVERRVVPGSPAEAFVNYLFGFATARNDSRQGPLEPFTVTESTTPVSGEEAVDVCSEGYCDQFSGFVVADGRLQSFALNGVAIDDRLAMPSKALAFGPISVRVVGAFERVSVDELAVVLSITGGGEELAVAWDDVRYVDGSRGELAVDLPASAYPPVIAPDGAQAVVFQFPTGTLGGEVVFDYTTPSAAEPVEVRVAVDELRP
jgi:hypothetical protein